MKKRILSMLLVIVMVLSMVPVTALAEGELTITSTKGSAVIGKDQLTLTVTGGAPTDTFMWSSDGTGVTLKPSDDTQSCILEGVRQGTSTVTVTNRNASKSGTKSFKIYLEPVELKIVAKTGETETDTLKVGQTLELGCTYQNADEVQEKSMKWEVTDVDGTNVMTINQNGVLEAKNVGTAKVTLAFNGARAYRTFTVAAADPGEITIEKSAESVKVGESITLTVSIGDDSGIAAKTYNFSVDSSSTGNVGLSRSDSSNR